VHILDVHEKLVSVKDAVTLSSRQYCIVLNPMDPKTRMNQWGAKKLVVGEATFFL